MTTPAAARTIRFHAPWYDERELAAVRAALEAHSAGDGPIGRKVEGRLAGMLGARRVLLTTSCTHALELALLALGIGPGQEVVCPSFTFVSSANAALRVGARPVFADIDERTLGLDPEDVQRRLTPRSAAILPVHYAGVAPDMQALLEIAQRRGLRVVEDAAQGLAASWRGRPLGTLGDAGCLSFHETKNVSCGEGGALVISDPELAKRAEVAREKGTNRAAFFRGEVDKYTWVAEGSSYVLSDVLAGILDAQLDKLAVIQSRRAAIVARYRAGLAEWAAARGVRLPAELPEREPNHHIFYLLYPDGAARDRAMAALRSHGVMATFHYVPLHSSPHGRSLGAQPPLPVTDRVAGTLLRLPLHPRLEADDVERVIEAVRRAGA
jgi:dTDP-4-amino-4,6-dideoxygalactose transaminase